MDELITQISKWNNMAEVIHIIIAFVLYILYANNKEGLKILTIILIEGLRNFQGKNNTINRYIKKNGKLHRIEAGCI